MLTFVESSLSVLYILHLRILHTIFLDLSRIEGFSTASSVYTRVQGLEIRALVMTCVLLNVAREPEIIWISIELGTNY